ncbi:hypothetical protein K9L05_02375 [Candidatus Babeliales bacterium]|nr:hypothetical protein [Candidatus Babeliales bacterium]
MSMKRNFIFFTMTAFFITSFFNTVQIKSHNQYCLDQQNLKEVQTFSLKQKQIKKLKKQIKLLTKKIDCLNLKIEEQKEVLNLHEIVTDKKISIQEKQNFFSKFNWKKFFTIVTSINAKKAALLIIALGVATGIINLPQIIKQVAYFIGKWTLIGLWKIFELTCKTVWGIPIAIYNQFKEALDVNILDYRENVDFLDYDKGTYNWLVNGYEKIETETGDIIKNFEKPGIEAMVNWQYGI